MQSETLAATAELGGLLASQLVVAFGWGAIFVLGGALPIAMLPLLALRLLESIAPSRAARSRSHRLVSGRLCPDDGAVMGDESAQSAQQLPDPALDTGTLAWRRGDALSGNLRDVNLWARHHLGGLAYCLSGGSLRAGAGADLHGGVRRALLAVDRFAQSVVLGAFGHDLWRGSGYWRLPGRSQRPIGSDLSSNHPVYGSRLRPGFGPCRRHCRAAPGWSAAGVRASGAGHIRRRGDFGIRRGSVNRDPRAIEARLVRRAPRPTA